MFGKKSFVSMLEMIIVVIALFVAFSVFFPGFYYKSRWSDMLLLLKNRDIILTADRVGQLYNYSFNASALQNFLDSLLGKEAGMVAWSETEGTIKSRLWIACNCTNEELNNIVSWFKGLRINDREIEVLPCYTNLEAINPCISSSDVLLIWGYKNLSSSVYLSMFKNYLKEEERGIVEIMDLNETQIDEVQRQIFGLTWVGGFPTGFIYYDEFTRKPYNTTDITYTAWKYFNHIPISLFATQDLGSGTPPSDPGFSPSFCGSLRAGDFLIQANVSYPFWICDSNKVYFDTNLTKKADVEVKEGENFYIQDFFNSSLNWTFSLNYIIDGNKIGVSFEPSYKFHDFIKEDLGAVGGLPPGLEKKAKYPPGGPQPPGWENAAWASYEFLYPIDGNEDRILIKGNQKTEKNPSWGNKNLTTPAVILNATPISRVAWISDFTEEGVGDDERLLLISLLLWTSNKRAVGVLAPELKLGFKTSYVNSVNKDMFEVYKFNLGLGYPF